MTLPDLETMKPLGDPFEILELHDGETREIRPERWEIGKATINPRDGRPAKVIPIMRLHVSAADAAGVPDHEARYGPASPVHAGRPAGLIGVVTVTSSGRTGPRTAVHDVPRAVTAGRSSDFS